MRHMHRTASSDLASSLMLLNRQIVTLPSLLISSDVCRFFSRYLGIDRRKKMFNRKQLRGLFVNYESAPTPHRRETEDYYRLSAIRPQCTGISIVWVQ